MRIDAGAAPGLPPRWWLPGLTADRRPAHPADAPDWALRVHRALAAEDPGEATPPADGVAALGAVLRRFVDEIPWHTDTAHVDHAAVHACFAAHLTERLRVLAARTLVLRLNTARVRGTLTTATPRERFAEFLRGAATPAGLAALLAEYPVLGRLLGQATLHAERAWRELLDRFSADRTRIVTTLLDGRDPGALVAVDAGRGEGHDGGRAVAVLTFADGSRVVYQPRPVELLAHFGELLDWLSAAVPGLELRRLATVRGAGYGWVEFVAAHPPAGPADVRAFYRRHGALLALLHATNGTDMHHENLLACGAQPVFVDVETLFHPHTEPPASTGSDPAQRRLMASVARTGVLPTMVLGEYGALDISGLGGDSGALLPDDRAAWADAGTDTMRLVRVRESFRPAANRPSYAGAEVDPVAHRDSLLTGFRDAYAAIRDNAGEFGDLLRRCAHDEIRVIVRDTASYVRALDESTHPDALRDAADRDALFDLVLGEQVNELSTVLEPYERAELWSGDVPLFRATPASRDILAGDGTVLPEALALSGLAETVSKMERFAADDLRVQEWVIDATLASRLGEATHTGSLGPPADPAGAAFDPQRAVQAAIGVAAELERTAARDAGRVNWLGLELVAGRHWQVLPLGAGLAEGYLGVAVFLADLARVTGMSRYGELAHAAIRPLPLLLDALAPETVRIIGCGGFSGLGGIGYGLARLGTALGDDEVHGWAEHAALLAGAAATDDDSLAGGRAGGALALRAVAAETGSAAASRIAAELFAGIGSAATGSGLLHGVTGVSWVCGSSTVDDGMSGDGWCSGTAGHALATGRAPAGWLDRLARTGPGPDHSLCHGELGICEVLTALGETTLATTRAAQLLDAIDATGPRCGTPRAVPSPGLLTGLAGIGHGLLRLAAPTEVPSVLRLRPGNNWAAAQAQYR